MKISYNWLKEFVDVPVSAKHLAEDLSLFGHEVDEIIKVGDDYIIDIEITANRGDCLSILGMAREVAALYNLKIKRPLHGGRRKSNSLFKIQAIDKDLRVSIKEPELCPRFTARIIDNLKIKESPRWIKNKLRTYGFRALNNIVDITNLVMIETGQPLHAFDHDKICSGKMIIRKAKNDESVMTLDGIDRKLDTDSIIIEDGKKIYDLAGIMGGFNSEIDTKSKTIILQGSIFNPFLIRRTSKRLKLTTDASYRFERKVDYSGTIAAVERATELIKMCCIDAKIGELVDIKSAKSRVRQIKIDPAMINQLIGKRFSEKRIVGNLRRLNIICENSVCKIPFYRKHDLTIWQAIAGEVARLYQFNKLQKEQIKPSKSKANMEFIKKERIKDLLVENGFTEIYSYSFVDEKLLKLLGADLKMCRYVINSITPENKYLRPNLEYSILSAVSKNPWAPEVNIFEIGKVFSASREKWQLGIASTDKNEENIKRVLRTLNIQTDIVPVDQKVLDFLKIRKKIKYIVVDLDKIGFEAERYCEKFKEIEYRPISDFPPTIRDLAFIVDKKINAEEVKKSISKISSGILLVELFDEFESRKFGNRKKNIAYHVWIQNLTGPVNKKLENKIVSTIIKKLKTKFGAEPRTR